MPLINDFANGLTPWFIRTPIFNGIRNAVMKPIDFIHDLLMAFKIDQRWILCHSSRIVDLEHFLNDYFSITYSTSSRDADIVSGLIVWIESANVITRFVYNKIEQRPKFYLYNKTEIPPKETTYLKNFSETLNSSSFIVWIPTSLSGGFSEDDLKSKIDLFKLAGKTYSIQYY